MTSKIINIVTAALAGEYQLRLAFDDGAVQIVDFKPFLQRSLQPGIKAYLDPKRFAAFRLEHGELIWGDYDLCFPIMDLYTNQIDKHHLLEAAA